MFGPKSSKVNFFQNYTSNEAQKPSWKRFQWPKEAFFSLFNKSQKWFKIVKNLRLTPLLFFGGLFFKVNFFQNYTSNKAQTKPKTLWLYIWLFARANIKSYPPGRMYMVIRLGEYMRLFARANIKSYTPGWIYMVIRLGESVYGYSPGQYNKSFARANIYGYSPGRISIWLFAWPI